MQPAAVIPANPRDRKCIGQPRRIARALAPTRAAGFCSLRIWLNASLFTLSHLASSPGLFGRSEGFGPARRNGLRTSKGGNTSTADKKWRTHQELNLKPSDPLFRQTVFQGGFLVLHETDKTPVFIEDLHFF